MGDWRAGRRARQSPPTPKPPVAPESPVTPVPPVRPLCRRFIGQVECLQGRGLYVPGDVAVPPPTGLGAPRVEYDASFAAATHEHLHGVRRQFRRRRYVEECLAGGREEHDVSFPITTHLIATFVHPAVMGPAEQ